MANKVKLVLLISLALNLLLVGAFSGYFLRGCKGHRPPSGPPRDLVEKLSPEHAKMFSQAMDSLHDRNRKNAEAIQQARLTVVEVLTAPEFNAAAFTEKMQGLHQLHGRMKDELVQTIAALAAKLDREERRALATILERGPLQEGSGGPPPGPPPRGNGFPPPPPGAPYPEGPPPPFGPMNGGPE